MREHEEDTSIAGGVLRFDAVAEEREQQVTEEWREKLTVSSETVQVPACEKERGRQLVSAQSKSIVLRNHAGNELLLLMCRGYLYAHARILDAAERGALVGVVVAVAQQVAQVEEFLSLVEHLGNHAA